MDGGSTSSSVDPEELVMRTRGCGGGRDSTSNQFPLFPSSVGSTDVPEFFNKRSTRNRRSPNFRSPPRPPVLFGLSVPIVRPFTTCDLTTH